MIIGHGGNVQALAARNHCPIDDIIDMSSNINPLGPPEGLEGFISENIAKIRFLPQPDARDMVEAFSRFYNIPTDRVIAGNGTTWFIYTLSLALQSKKVLIAGPTYADYRDGCLMHHVPFEFLMATEENNFQPDIEGLRQKLSADHSVDTVMICNPNNPTGALIPVEQLTDLLSDYPDHVFVIDESYLPFVDNAEKISLVGETRFSNLIVLSSMSKIYRIPGLRTGYLTADPAVVDNMMAYYQPWSVNALAQAAIVYILENHDAIIPFLEKTRQFVMHEKKAFYNAFNGNGYGQIDGNRKMEDEGEHALSGLTLYPAETYFILAKLPARLTSHVVCHEVGNHKILIRDCSNFEGLSDQFVRFSLRDRETNLLLADTLKNIMKR